MSKAKQRDIVVVNSLENQETHHYDIWSLAFREEYESSRRKDVPRTWIAGNTANADGACYYNS